jgi:putative ABC transport system permease protein
MSRWQFRGENPLGRRLAFDTSGPFLEIVGVVGDVRHERLSVGPEPEIYLPHAQSPLASMMLAVRTTGNPSTLTPAIRGEVHTLDKDQPVTDVATLDERLERSISRSRFDAVVLGLFAALACVLAVVGVYGLVSYSVAQRTYEFGVRLALGADKRGVVWAALREGFGLTVAGIGIGLVGAIALTSVLSSLLYSVRPRDPVVLSAACLLLATTSLVATWLPARRAAKVDPMKALRYE